MNSSGSAKERKHLLLAHPDVSTWIKDRARPGTGVTQLDHVRIFLDRTGLDPDQLVALAKRDGRAFKNLVMDFVHAEQARGLKAKYVRNIWWSVRSFLVSVDSAPEWNPTVEEGEADDENYSRVVPTQEQVRQVAGAVKSARDRMVVMVLASSGVRIGTLAAQNGEPDGLRLKHLVDLQLEPEPHFTKSPPMLRVPVFLSKGKMAYYTGISPAAAEQCITYLRERRQRGEQLTGESPLVVPDPRGTREARLSKDGHAFVLRKSLASRVQAAIDSVAPSGIRWTPHSLRAFASTQLEACEAKGLISSTRHQFFLGHRVGSVERGYDLSRPLSPEKIDELRGSYSACLPLLSLSSGSPAERGSVSREDAVRALVEFFGSEKDRERLDHAASGTISKEEVVEMLRRALVGGSKTPPAEAPASRPAGKKTHAAASLETEPDPAFPSEVPFPLDEAERRFRQGWTYVGPFGPDRVILQRPGAM